MSAIWEAIKGYLTLPVLSSLLRGVLKAAGPLIVANGLATGAQVEVAIAAIVTLFAFVWGAVNARRTSPPPPA